MVPWPSALQRSCMVAWTSTITGMTPCQEEQLACCKRFHVYAI